MWIFFSSIKASIVIAMIMIIKMTLKERLPARWHYALWFLVIFRLLLPFEIPSPASIFNAVEEEELKSTFSQIFENIVISNKNDIISAIDNQQSHSSNSLASTVQHSEQVNSRKN